MAGFSSSTPKASTSGARRYKAKFDPQWRPRYLASLGGAQLSVELIGITTLISGGLRKKYNPK